MAKPQVVATVEFTIGSPTVPRTLTANDRWSVPCDSPVAGVLNRTCSVS